MLIIGFVFLSLSLIIYLMFSFLRLLFSSILFISYRTAIESIDIPRVLSQQGGEAVYPLPRIRALEVHPKLNLATLLFAVRIF